MLRNQLSCRKAYLKIYTAKYEKYTKWHAILYGALIKGQKAYLCGP